jgi:DNA-binding NarL/FixJ family response regulator
MNVLIVDDHPMTVAGYTDSLSQKDFFEKPFVFTKAYDCETAFAAIEKCSFELVIVDQGLPSYEQAGIFSGSDLAKFIRKKTPSCKVILITAHTEVIIVYDIVKKIQPDGLLIKNDITPENLPIAVKEILDGTNFKSPTVKKIIQEVWKKDLMFDDINRQILLYLSKGYKIKDLEKIVSLSISPIQRRIAQMKEVFDVKEDSSLVKEAFKQGFL